MKTIREYVAAASDRFREAGIAMAANLDARLQDVLGGDLEPFTEALTTEERRRALER